MNIEQGILNVELGARIDIRYLALRIDYILLTLGWNIAVSEEYVGSFKYRRRLYSGDWTHEAWQWVNDTSTCISRLGFPSALF